MMLLLRKGELREFLLFVRNTVVIVPRFWRGIVRWHRMLSQLGSLESNWLNGTLGQRG